MKAPAVRVEIMPISGMGEIRPGDDLVGEITRNAPWLEDGDILIVTSKIVSKVEGRLITTPTDDPVARESLRQQAIRDETVRVVARRGPLVIAETRHGLVMAAAGVDASNVSLDEIALLPIDPDRSARQLRDGVAERVGRNVAVVISDSMGRPWRHGISDVAIGVAGIAAVIDERGTTDKHGNVLSVTEVAIADELAAAGDLAKGKLSDVPVAVVRGLSYVDDGKGSSALLRGSGDDLFRMGTSEALALGQAQAGSASSADSAGSAASPDSIDANGVVGLHADVRATLNTMRLDAGDGTGQAAVREGFFALLAARPDATRRACAPGHITASTVLLDHDRRRVLLTLHPRVGAWVQLGGHCEDSDVSLVAAAAREALEESGIPGIEIDPEPIDLDVHAITCSLGIPTRHFDVRFVGVTPPGAKAVMSAESDDLRWFELDQLPDNIAAELPELIRRAARRIAR